MLMVYPVLQGGIYVMVGLIMRGQTSFLNKSMKFLKGFKLKMEIPLSH